MSRVQAKDLKYNKFQLIKIDRHIRDILATIEDDIKDAHDSGKIYIKYSLPHAFSIENLTSGEARRKIHSYIISDIAYRDFVVQYIKTNQKYYLIIAWVTKEEKFKKEAEIEVLKYYHLSENDRKEQRPNVAKYEGIKSLA